MSDPSQNFAHVLPLWHVPLEDLHFEQPAVTCMTHGLEVIRPMPRRACDPAVNCVVTIAGISDRHAAEWVSRATAWHLSCRHKN